VPPKEIDYARVKRAATEELLTKLRDRIDDLVLRTTFITGFPGETREQFDELLAFVDRWQFERLGVFPYSFEPDTPSAKLDGHLPEEEKQARRDELMALQQGIAHAHAAGHGALWHGPIMGARAQ